jgi:hypothetical protein
MFSVSLRRVPRRSKSLTAPASTSRGVFLPFARACGDLVEGLPELLDLVVAQHPLARMLWTRPPQAGGRIAFDQLLPKAPAECRADERQDAIGSDRSPAGDSFEEGAQLAARYLSRRLLTNGRLLHNRLESASVVAVRGGAATAGTSFDVVLEQDGDGQSLPGLTLG